MAFLCAGAKRGLAEPGTPGHDPRDLPEIVGYSIVHGKNREYTARDGELGPRGAQEIASGAARQETRQLEIPLCPRHVLEDLCLQRLRR